jgi:hypothetical protein
MRLQVVRHFFLAFWLVYLTSLLEWRCLAACLTGLCLLVVLEHPQHKLEGSLKEANSVQRN